MDYAVELDLLDTNPIRALKWTAPAKSTTREVDRRSVVNHRQARDLLEAVREQEPSGPRLVAFFAMMYYSALRPEEAVNVDRDDIALPPPGQNESWGDLHLTSSHTARRATLDRRRLAARHPRPEASSRGRVADCSDPTTAGHDPA